MMTVFGVDHSPWVQAAVLALVDHGHEVRLRPLPPFGYFLKRGFVMPICSHEDGSWTADSLAIMDGVGLPQGDRAAIEADLKELERLFLAYSLHRTGPGRRWAFLRAWSRMADVPMTVGSIAGRALLCAHFTLLIELARLRVLKPDQREPSPSRLIEGLAPWSARLEATPFLGGDAPGASDYALLGQIECMSSGPTDWAMDAVIAHEPLTQWLRRMHDRLSHHPTMYSRRVFEDAEGPQGAGPLAQAWFLLWTGLIVLLPPLSLPILGYALSRRKRAPNRSGARLRSARSE